MGSSEAVQRTTEKVKAWLHEIHGYLEEGPNGEITFRQGSARIFVHVVPYGDDGSAVMINALVLTDVPRSPALFERLAFINGEQAFTTFYAVASEDQSLVDIGCSATVLGTHLDREELGSAAVAVASEADEKDDALQKEFGGIRFHEEG